MTQLDTHAGYRVITTVPREAWREAYDGDPNAQAFHAPDWVDGVCAAGGFEDASRAYETPDGRLLVLPMVRRRLLGGVLATQASMPMDWGIGGIISRDGIGADDVAAVCTDLRNQSTVLRTFIRPSARTGPAWSRLDQPWIKPTSRLCHVLDLDGGFETVWSKRFTKTARRQVRKAEKAGVVVERDDTGARLPEFLALMEHSVTRWAGQMNEPLILSRWRARRRRTADKLHALAAAMPGRFHLYLAMWEGQAVAGTVVCAATGTRATSGAMIKELAGPVAANYLLDRVAIEDACAAGSTHYDIGESGGSPGLAMYKTRFGAEPISYRSFVVERLPLTELSRSTKSVVKRVIGFRGGPPAPTP